MRERIGSRVLRSLAEEDWPETPDVWPAVLEMVERMSVLTGLVESERDAVISERSARYRSFVWSRN